MTAVPPTPTVWVTHLEWPGGMYTSVHRSKAGAQERLTEKAASLGISLARIDSGENVVDSYGLSHLEVEP